MVAAEPCRVGRVVVLSSDMAAYFARSRAD
jgi:hypothetical protein